MGSFRTPRPDALLVGAPKAGTSALHAALALHPQVFSSRPKEPKYFMCADAPPPSYRGPGDAHSQQEWVWRREDYEALFAAAPGDAVRLESTPFYLYLRNARRRIAEELPDARLVAVVRDPVDRAYSNWMHLWSDGLEPVGDFVEAFAREDERVADGWAPFWHYRRLGLYGRQLEDLYRHVDADRILVLRYRDLVQEPAATLDRVCVFLGLEPGLVTHIPRDNSRPYAAPGAVHDLTARAMRAGARAGALVPPKVWRRASKPLVAAMHWRGDTTRPALAKDARAALVETYLDDIELLEKVTGQSFDDWRGTESLGSFAARVAQTPG
ncbi:sulfotransferase [Mumia sp. zg.B53]|uniref:sulfotransferase family protein n=1 Tax=unclassified Mumia TaxID=2621872 RepID=UPI001C6EC0EA|nr:MULTISPECIES: sulfotransferase [unclassified Mumia]MBW9215520.1 sulfotransferase [Mumia sp. zg.B53]MDD9347272.1 sulfotransferase [Mumia sp.]